jgi:hypothetical protein
VCANLELCGLDLNVKVQIGRFLSSLMVAIKFMGNVGIQLKEVEVKC